MEVIILAGGLGTRLSSVVNAVPKCMAPISGKPFLWYLLKYLTNYDVSRVILSVGYLRQVIFDWIENIKDDFPFAFDYAIEETPLGTGGGIKLAMEKISDDNAVILNGDTFFDVDIDELMSFHRNNKAANITIALKPMKDFDRYGTVSKAPDDRIISFNEKKQCKLGEINGGVYILSKNCGILDTQEGKFSFETKILQKQCGDNGCIFGVTYNGYFIDIGIPEDYHIADQELKELIK